MVALLEILPGSFVKLSKLSLQLHQNLLKGSLLHCVCQCFLANLLDYKNAFSHLMQITVHKWRFGGWGGGGGL